MKKIINFNLNITTIIIIIIIALTVLIGGWKLYNNKVSNLNDKIEAEIKLKNALLDTITNYRNEKKEWVAEKLTIQITVKDLEKMNSQLTIYQKELLVRIKEVNKKNDIISAALILSQLKIDSLLLRGEPIIDTVNKKIIFKGNYNENKKEMNYSFTVGNAIPSSKLTKPTLTIDSLSFENKQFVSFQWKDEKGKPVSFSISNSNDFFKTVNIDSYAIPELNKDQIKPSFWQKVGNFFTGSGNTLLTFGAGGIVGATTLYLLTK